ncbi:MAG: N-acetyltransferase [Pseudomonadota bacterium]
MRIRPEIPRDHLAIHDLTERAFDGKPYSDGTEAGIPAALRIAGDLTLSLVAEAEDIVIGHVALSPVQIVGVNGSWYGLGPIAVAPDLQRQGIGRALVAQAMDRLRGLNAAGCVLIGNPDVYGPMGFVSDGRLTYRDTDPRYVQYLVLNGVGPCGELVFAPAFG